MIPWTHLYAAGSSPLTRGKRCRYYFDTPRGRLIPAHAGKTDREESDAAGTRAHPRSRGENQDPAGAVRYGGGSSPLTRGKRVGCLDNLGQIRLIPAHAGKTTRCTHSLRTAWAHPRSRGENGLCTKPITERNGSSPLTRGKRFCALSARGRARLIPAHAGKTRTEN